MNTKIVWAVVVIIILIGGGYWYMNMMPATATVPEGAAGKIPAGGSMGTYAYECDEHVTFTMTPADEMASIAIAPSNGGAFPPASTLTYVSRTDAGQVFSGNGITFTAKGESVTLASAGSEPLNCSPVPSQDSAPFNFGD